jgi:predicted aspartyl protease
MNPIEVGFVGLAAALSLISPCLGQSAPQPCQLGKLVSLDVVTLPPGEIALPVVINDRPMKLLVDTGSVYSSITQETASSLGLTTNYTARGGAFVNNIAINQFANLDSLSIGALHSSGSIPVLIAPNNLLPITMSGLLGPDILKLYDVEFDFFHGKLNVFAHSKCPGDAVYWTRGAFAAENIKVDAGFHIAIDAALDGKPVTASLDTGSDTSFMSLDAARSLLGWSDHEPKLRTLGTHSINGVDTQLYDFPFGSLSFQGLAVLEPKILLLPRQNISRYGRDEANVILGMSVLRQLRIYVAYEEGKVYMTGAEAQ